MKIRSSNLTLRLIQFFFDGYRPKDLCSFWWMGIAAWVIAVISPPMVAISWTIPWFVAKSHRDLYRFPNEGSAFPIILGGVLVFMISCGAVISFLGEAAVEAPIRVLILAYILAPIGMSIFAAVVVLSFRFVGLVIDWITAGVRAILNRKKINRTFEHKPKRESILMARLRDWKDRTCTRIDYID